MNVTALDLTGGEKALLDRAVYVYRQKNRADPGLTLPGQAARTGCTPEQAITEALGTYLALFGPRYGQPDELSQAVVYGSRHTRAPVTDLDEVARLLVNRHRPSTPTPAADLDEVARRLVHGSKGDGQMGRWGDGERVAPPPYHPTSPPPEELDLTDEHQLVQRATLVCRRKNGSPQTLREVIVESLEVYLRLYEPAYGPQDSLSRTVVHGPQSAPVPVADLDEVARLVVRTARCVRCGNCCRRTIGVRVTAEEIERIEALGYRREDLLDRDGMIKAGPGGCTFLVDGGPGKARCRIHAQRPQICRDFFCADQKPGFREKPGFSPGRL